MNQLKRKILIKVLVFSDLMVLWFVCHIAINIDVNNLSISYFISLFKVQFSFNYIILFLCIFLIWNIVLSSFDIYQSQRLIKLKVTLLKVIEASFLGTLLTYGPVMFFYPAKHNLITYLVIFVGMSSCIIMSRIALQFLLNWVRLKGRNLRYVVIAGTNHRAIKFAERLIASPELGYRLNGFVDDEWDGIGVFRESEFSLASDLSSFAEFLREKIIDEVFIFLPLQSKYSIICDIIAKCEEQGITVRFDTNMFNLKIAHQDVEPVADGNMITVKSSSINGLFFFAKRLIDISITSVLLIILSPLFLLIALLIKTTSHGPIFFVQKRVGLNKRHFSLIKFRTMVPNAEQMISDLEAYNEVDGPAFKLKNDPRITTIGKFLRKTSLDELPQLLNVLKGDMSLVGPRPLPLRDYAGFSEDWHRRRFSVRPGVTCFWQVKGRNLIPFDQWMQLDMKYIDNWSLLLDLKLLLLTIPAVIKGSGV